MQSRGYKFLSRKLTLFSLCAKIFAVIVYFRWLPQWSASKSTKDQKDQTYLNFSWTIFQTSEMEEPMISFITLFNQEWTRHMTLKGLRLAILPSSIFPQWSRSVLLLYFLMTINTLFHVVIEKISDCRGF